MQIVPSERAAHQHGQSLHLNKDKQPSPAALLFHAHKSPMAPFCLSSVHYVQRAEELSLPASSVRSRRARGSQCSWRGRAGWRCRVMSSKAIKIRVKVGERNKDVEIEPNDKVCRIKELAFPDEVRRGQQIRLFYAGKELNSNDTVSSVKLTSGCVTHAIIRAAAPSSTGRNDGPASGSSRAAKGSGVWLALVTGGVLCMLWVAQSQYPNFFTAPASTLLVGLTAGHLFLTYKLLIRTGPAGGAASS